MNITRYLLKRLSIAAAILVVMSSLLFFANRIEDPRNRMLSEYTSAEQWEAWGEELGLNRPVMVQYIAWIGNSMKIDFGNSAERRTSARGIALDHAAETLRLVAVSFAFSVIFSAAAILAILYISQLEHDLGSTGRLIRVIIPAIPPFLPGVFLAHIFFPNSLLFPIVGNAPWSFVLPSVALGTVIAYPVVRLLDAARMDVANADPTCQKLPTDMTRVADRWKDVAVRALLKLLKSSQFYVPVLFAAVFFTEFMFDMHGLSNFIVSPKVVFDLPMYSRALMIFTMAYVAVMLLMDVARAFVDRQVREGASEVSLTGGGIAADVRPVPPREWPLFGRRPLLALTILVVIVLLSVCVPLIVTYRGDAVGTDWLYRIFLSLRQALLILALAVIAATIIGVVAGLIANRFGGITEQSLAWLFDLFATLPIILLGFAAHFIWLQVYNYSSLYSSTPILFQATVYPACVMAVIFSGVFFHRVRADFRRAGRQGVVFSRHLFSGILKDAAVIAGPLLLIGSILHAAGGFWAGWGGPILPVQYSLASIWWTLLASLVLILTILSLNFLGQWAIERLEQQPDQPEDGATDAPTEQHAASMVSGRPNPPRPTGMPSYT